MQRHSKSWSLRLTLLVVGLLLALTLFFSKDIFVDRAVAQTAPTTTDWTTRQDGAPVPNWDNLTFGNLPGIGADGYFRLPEQVVGKAGYDPTRPWRRGQPPAEIFQLGDLQDYFQPHLFTLEQISQITGLDPAAVPLADFGLLRGNSLGGLVNTVAGLAEQPLGAVPPLLDLVLQQNPHLFDRWEWDQEWVWDRKWIPPVHEWIYSDKLGENVRRLVEKGHWQQLDTGKYVQLDTGNWVYDQAKQELWEAKPLGEVVQDPIFKSLPLNNLDLRRYSISTIPGLILIPLENFANWQNTTLAQIPGLPDVPFAKFPKPPNSTGFGFVALHDVTYGSAEHRRHNTVTGSDQVGFNYPCDEDHDAPEGCGYVELSAPSWLGLAGDMGLHGKQWIQGGKDPGGQMVPGGEGILGALNGGMEPTGRLPFGPVFKVVLTKTDESKGEAEFGLYFRVCKRGWVDLGCTPYFIGPIPWLTHYEKDLIFIGLTPGKAPDNIPGLGDLPPELQRQIEELTGGQDLTVDSDCLGKLVGAAPPADRPAAVTAIPQIMQAAQKHGVSDPAQVAYILATAQAETNFRSRNQDGGAGGYETGRGYSQLTHDYNYRYFSRVLQIDLMSNPEQANEPKVASEIIVHGMKYGTFTGMTSNGTLIPGGGKKLSNYINGAKQDFAGARSIVNDGDRRGEIAGYARNYLKVLQGCSLSSGTGDGKATGKFIIPARGPVTSEIGYRIHPITRQRKFHAGLDIGAPNGSPAKAANGGKVIHAGWMGGYGNIVIVDHGNGLTTRYAHLSGLNVRLGQTVSQGQQVGRVGSTGRSTGPHLHFEVRKNGKPVNPRHYVNF